MTLTEVFSEENNPFFFSGLKEKGLPAYIPEHVPSRVGKLSDNFLRGNWGRGQNDTSAPSFTIERVSALCFGATTSFGSFKVIFSQSSIL